MSSHRLRIVVVPLGATILLFPLCSGNAASAVWKHAPHAADDLAAESRTYRAHRDDYDSRETIRGARYRIRTDPRTLHPPGLLYDDETTPEFQLRLEPDQGRPRKHRPRRLRRFPDPDDWSQLFSEENRHLFMFREDGTSLVGFDLVRGIRFRGALPFIDGADIREWEGLAYVDATTQRIIEIRARPNGQEERLRHQHARWSTAFKITLGIFGGPFFIPGPSFRLAPKPLAYRCFIRYDTRSNEIWLPTLMSYEIRQAVTPDRTVLRKLTTHTYTHTEKGTDLFSRGGK